MRPPDEQTAAREAAMVSAAHALAQGCLRAAERHLEDAGRLGASYVDIQRLHQAILTAQAEQSRRARRSVWAGLGLGLLGYFVLSFTISGEWKNPLWIALAFVLVPGVVGYLTGRWQGPERAPRDRFKAGMLAGGIGMALYTGVWLIVLRLPLESGGDAGQLLLLWFMVTAVFAALAGAVAGLVSARLTWRGIRGDGT